MALVPIKEEDKKKSYYKYYEMGIAEVSKEDLDFIEKSEGTVDECLEPEDCIKLLSEDIIPAKMGYYPTKDKGLLISGNIPMPDVTADMLYWWFAWHGLDPFRYAIWDPEDHFGLKINELGRQRALDPSVPVPEKNWGATHIVDESCGGPAIEITIAFKDPKEFGFDSEAVKNSSCEFIVCANCINGPLKIPVTMIELAKKIDGKMMFEARFWLGYHMEGGKPVFKMPVLDKLPKEDTDMIAKGLLAHNIKEFSNLNKILPSVYEENKNIY